SPAPRRSCTQTCVMIAYLAQVVTYTRDDYGLGCRLVPVGPSARGAAPSFGVIWPTPRGRHVPCHLKGGGVLRSFCGLSSHPAGSSGPVVAGRLGAWPVSGAWSLWALLAWDAPR